MKHSKKIVPISRPAPRAAGAKIETASEIVAGRQLAIYREIFEVIETQLARARQARELFDGLRDSK